MRITFKLFTTSGIDATRKIQDAKELLPGSRWSGRKHSVGWAKQRIGGRYAGMIGRAAVAAVGGWRLGPRSRRGVAWLSASAVVVVLRIDAAVQRMRSKAATGSGGSLANTDARTRRMRLLLEGSSAFATGGRSRFVLTLEVGVARTARTPRPAQALRSAGSCLHRPRLGPRSGGEGAGLVAHEDTDYSEWGAAGSVRIKPVPARTSSTARVRGCRAPYRRRQLRAHRRVSRDLYETQLHRLCQTIVIRHGRTAASPRPASMVILVVPASRGRAPWPVRPLGAA